MAFRPDKLTVKAQEALQTAQELALNSGHQQLQPLHLLKGLMTDKQGIIVPLLQSPVLDNLFLCFTGSH